MNRVRVLYIEAIYNMPVGILPPYKLVTVSSFFCSLHIRESPPNHALNSLGFTPDSSHSLT